ncbi:pyridoxine 5'-phosphate synthase [Spongiibacter sp.]|uniref:pyridoxine 5'-phosphate synthase n=1 Tax=Spongiibacter sp. TaxID=2024860 RepID=UPI003564B5C4
MTALSINLNKIALIRNSRDTAYPSVTEHAQRCINAGAHGITVHPRPDQRHIRADDCYALAEVLDVEFNIEGNPLAPAMKSDRHGVSDYPGFMEIIRRTRPAQCTLVPDNNSQLTSDHGFDLQRDGDTLLPIIEELKQLGVRVSLFMDPDPNQIVLAKAIGADRIELYTGPYAEHFGGAQQQDTLARFVEASKVAADCNLGLNAGHDLNLHNLALFKNSVTALLEVSIGHAFTVDAIELGLDNCIAAYLDCLR